MAKKISDGTIQVTTTKKTAMIVGGIVAALGVGAAWIMHRAGRKYEQKKAGLQQAGEQKQ